MNSIEIELADKSEDRVFTADKNKALSFLRQYSSRKGATVRIDPGGSMIEFFDTTRQSAVKQAIEHVRNIS